MLTRAKALDFGFTAKTTIAVCQVLDVATTTYGLWFLMAEEQNPLLASWLGSPVSLAMLLLLKTALCWRLCLAPVVTFRDRLILGGAALLCIATILRNTTEIIQAFI